MIKKKQYCHHAFILIQSIGVHSVEGNYTTLRCSLRYVEQCLFSKLCNKRRGAGESSLTWDVPARTRLNRKVAWELPIRILWMWTNHVFLCPCGLLCFSNVVLVSVVSSAQRTFLSVVSVYSILVLRVPKDSLINAICRITFSETVISPTAGRVFSLPICHLWVCLHT